MPNIVERKYLHKPQDRLKEILGFYLFFFKQGRMQMQSPTTPNYEVEFPTFGEIAGVSTSGVQQISLTLGKPPS